MVPVHLARVVRIPSTDSDACVPVTTGSVASLHVEVGLARVTVPVGFDTATLSAVLDVLERRAAEGRAR